jgi:branched-chain amino acid transport system ATP-binding protein
VGARSCGAVISTLPPSGFVRTAQASPPATMLGRLLTAVMQAPYFTGECLSARRGATRAFCAAVRRCRCSGDRMWRHPVWFDEATVTRVEPGAGVVVNEHARDRHCLSGRGDGGAVIEVSELVVHHGAAVVLDGVDLTVGAGEMVALVGAAGAGKSTLVNTLARIVRPFRGRVTVRGRLVHLPQGRQLFGHLSVEDNLLLGGRRIRNRDTAPIYQILPALIRLRHRKAALLSSTERHLVAVGRALMRRPDVLVIDELSLGLTPLVAADLARQLQELSTRQGLAILLTEQDMRPALELCARAYVLDAGRVIAEGNPAELAKNLKTN